MLYSDIPYLEARRHVITSQVGWWLKLDKFQLGWDVLEVAKEVGYSISVLTKGPSKKFAAWAEKIEWCNRHLAGYIDGVTITHDKGLVYGTVLVDDWPEYIKIWLEHRPRGLVIMPAHDHNAGYSHSNVVRYDGMTYNIHTGFYYRCGMAIIIGDKHLWKTMTIEVSILLGKVTSKLLISDVAREYSDQC